MLATAIAKTLSAVVNGTDAERIVRMRLKGVTVNMGVVQLNAGQMRQGFKLRTILIKGKKLWYTLHCIAPFSDWPLTLIR
jgi:hypothetical protein